MSSQPAYHFALTGYPLGHSLSPQIHNAALRAAQLAGEYVLRPFSPDQILVALEIFAAELRAGDLHGMNVTIPHKQVVVQMCDERTQSAQLIGAVNMIYLRDGKIIGDNSDARGFMAPLTVLPQWSKPGRTALVLGAGGSARAVIYALSSNGWNVQVTSRRMEQAQQIVHELTPCASAGKPTAIPFPLHPTELDTIDLLVNTTPLGMHPNPSGCPWPENLQLPNQAAIYDLVYNPRETRLLKLGASQGLKTIGGITMLVEQAAIAFECWTGHPAPREAMYAAVTP